MKVKDLIGKEARIYPNDHYSKQGVIMDINDNGVLFKITQSQKADINKLVVGSLHFISYSANLSFSVIDPDLQSDSYR
jgi:hypothetical protein